LHQFKEYLCINLKYEIIYHKLAALIFLAAFFAQTFSSAFIIVDYYAYTNSYAKDCINKSKPEMHCNGKCQMMKKIAKEEKKSQNNPETNSNNKNEITLFAESFFAKITQTFIIENNSKITPSTTSDKTIDRSFDIFHPPQI